MHFDPSFISKISVGLLLVKLVGSSIVCQSFCRHLVVCKVQVVVGNDSLWSLEPVKWSPLAHNVKHLKTGDNLN